MSNRNGSAELAGKLNGIIKINEAQVHSHLDQVVRGTVEETLNKLLDEEADQLCNACRYERSDSGGTSGQAIIRVSCTPRRAR